MSALFSKELPQSSLQSQEGDQSLLCLEKFINPPRTLYDEIGQQEQDFYTSLKVSFSHKKKKKRGAVNQFERGEKHFSFYFSQHKKM